jgi:replication factor A1
MAVAEQTYLPISELSAYQTKWVIKARVTNKSQLRTWSKNGNDGKVFHVELLDAEGGEIRANFFNVAVDKFHNTLEKGKCFTFSRGNIKVANKQYNTTNHRYELIFDKDALVEPASDDSKIEAIKFSFVSLRSLQTRSVPCSVDLCGIITSFQPVKSLTGKDGSELVKRDITLADDTATSLTIAVWGDRAKQEDSVFQGNPVIVLKSVAIKEWQNTRGGSLSQGGSLVFNSTCPEAKRVSQWWSQGGSTQELLQLSGQPGSGGGGESARHRNAVQTSLTGVRLASERLGNQPELFSVVARLALVQTRKQGEPQPLHYMACQEPKEGQYGVLPCNKRVSDDLFCASCNRHGKVAARLNARCRFVDYEDQAWLTSFHEAATKILGMSGDEVKALESAAAEKGEAGREDFEAAIRKHYFERPMNIIVRAKLDSYNGEARANVTVVDSRPVSYAEHGRFMLKEISEMLAKEAKAGA